MKKLLLGIVIAAVLTGCSSDPEKLQTANDSYQKYAEDVPGFSPLNSGGVTLPRQSNLYELPAEIKKGATVDIRPPSTPLAIIKNSLTQFDGERALIVYSDQQAAVYNLQQVQRLLKEDGINSNINGLVLLSDWAPTGRADDSAGTEIRYKIEQINANGASALAVSVQQMRRDGVIFTPDVAAKQRYTSDRLNRLVAALTEAYNKQQQDLSSTVVGAFQSALITDNNGRLALAMDATFAQAWSKLASALPQLGFDTVSEVAGRGQRELKYKPLDKSEWLRFGVSRPDLEKGTYHLQISAVGKQSAAVLSDEDGKALNEDAAKAVYNALAQLLAH